MKLAHPIAFAWSCSLLQIPHNTLIWYIDKTILKIYKAIASCTLLFCSAPHHIFRISKTILKNIKIAFEIDILK